MRKSSSGYLAVALALMLLAMFVFMPSGAGSGALPREMAFWGGIHNSLGQLDEAKKDYDFLLKINPASYRAYYGLAEIATQRKDWQTVVENCDFYLKHAPPGTAECLDVERRLREAKHKSK